VNADLVSALTLTLSQRERGFRGAFSHREREHHITAGYGLFDASHLLVDARLVQAELAGGGVQDEIALVVYL